ncbi:MAG: DUF559 domain-containing protein [Nanoarchaeota archaeon]
MEKITKFCEICNIDFYSYMSQKRKYCSRKCFYKRIYKKGINHPDYKIVNIVCYLCKKKIFVKPHKSYRKFCSSLCSEKYRTGKNHHNFKEKEEKICPLCKNIFFVSKIRFNAKFCSVKCRAKFNFGKFNFGKNKNGKNINCKNCKKEFYVEKSLFGKRKYCSRKCLSISKIGHIPWNKNKKGLMPKPWNKGLTKETDERVRKYGEKIIEKRLYFTFPKKDTSIEIKMREELTKRSIKWIKHKVIGNIVHKYQCDIFIEPNIVIECDGDYWHKYPNGRDIDKIRTNEMKEKGYIVFRFWENEINKNVSLCVDKVQSYLKKVGENFEKNN